jgi:hypothetical protein
LIAVTACNAGAQAASRDDVTSVAVTARSAATSAPADCDYNTCALRMKLSWGHWRILRGEHEQQVAELGMFTAPNIESVIATSPEALAEVRTFRKNYTSGEVIQVLGVLLMSVGIASASANHSYAVPFTAIAGGGAMLFYGVSRHVTALNALHKTIWLYNRSLKR